MKAIIRLDVPDWQIGQEVKVYFPDTMCVKGTCEPILLDNREQYRRSKNEKLQ